MSEPEDIVQGLYADYRIWCQHMGIPPETWESFHNELQRQREEVSAIVRKYQDQWPRPIQPNDEDRAVAEAIRILGVKE